MTSIPTLAAIRFGSGLGAGIPLPAGADAVWNSLQSEARPERFPITSWETRLIRGRERRALQRARRDDDDPELIDQLRALNQADSLDNLSDLRNTMARLTYAETGFHERLMRFWANHFACERRGGALWAGRSAFIEEALRPHLMGSFSALLRSAVLHPVMLLYLDQAASVGPHSRVGRRRGRGLNENLARELLELHTLGIAGGYSQQDVTQLARLLTGLAVNLAEGFHFQPLIAEPGIIEIFGERYGGRPMTLEHITEFLDDLALRSETAEHLARKLAQHFVQDTPDPQLVAHMAVRFERSRGDLPTLYQAMLEHPAAWVPTLQKTRAPFEMMAAALRATGWAEAEMMMLRPRELRHLFLAPLQAMGEPFDRVPSPAGYGEEAAYFVTPAGLAARIDWAMALAQRLDPAPDPRAFVELALRDAASEGLRRAASGAETRAQGVGVILAAPDFNRR